MRMVAVDFEAITAASRFASLSALPAATTRLTSPIRAASSAGTISPSSSISIACLAERLRVSATIGVEQNSRYGRPACRIARHRPPPRGRSCDELAAGRRRRALDRRDHRLGQGGDLLHHARAAPEDVGRNRPARDRIGAVCAHLLEIVPGAEHRAFGGQHDRLDAPVGGDGGEAFGQRGEHRLAQRVARLRPVEREDGDALAVLAPQTGAASGRAWAFMAVTSAFP